MRSRRLGPLVCLFLCAVPAIAAAKPAPRPIPDYDGRGEEPATPGDVWLWVPRILLSPLYLVSEYVVRRPLGWVTTTLEKEIISSSDIQSNVGLSPTLGIDVGFRPNLGLYFFADDAVAKDNQIRARATTWGLGALSATVLDRVEVFPGHLLGVRGELIHRDDFIFHGLGPSSRDADLGRFSATFGSGRLAYEATLWRTSRVKTYAGVEHASFDTAEGCCADATLEDRVAEGRYAPPPGVVDSATFMQQGVELSLDTRDEREPPHLPLTSDYAPAPSTGFRIAAHAAHAGELYRTRSFAGAPRELHEWIRYGGELSGFVDVTGDQRVVKLSAWADFADPVRSDDVPLYGLVRLGGERPLGGFRSGRLVDRRALAATFEYAWPIWISLDGALHYSVGNVFPADWQGLELDALRSSFGVGVRTSRRSDHPLELLLAFGTQRFDAGGDVESVRFTAGWNTGF